MKKTILSLLLVLLFAPIAPAQNAIAQNPEVAGNIKLLEAWIEAQMAYRNLPGMSVGVVYDSQLIWARGFGYADVEQKIPATPATIYRMASVTKTFTATAIMQLRDAGKLSLDDPVVKHLPWFKIKSWFNDAPAITIRHLLTHTSGLPSEAAYPYWTDFIFPTLEQIKEALPNQEAVFAPETRRIRHLRVWGGRQSRQNEGRRELRPASEVAIILLGNYPNQPQKEIFNETNAHHATQRTSR